MKGLSRSIDVKMDFFFTDTSPYVPYFLIGFEPDIPIGVGSTKYYNFSKNDTSNIDWSYINNYYHVTNALPTTDYWNRDTLKLSRMSKNENTYLLTSLFIGKTQSPNYDELKILMCGVVKEEFVHIVRELNLNNFEESKSYIEVWLSEDFDIPKSIDASIRGMYRKYIRTKLIQAGLRIKIKTVDEMKSLLGERKSPKFNSLNDVQTKIKNLCLAAAKANL